jgi:phosphotriesterase-related protein
MKILLFFLVSVLAFSCSTPVYDTVVTVGGEVRADKMGATLAHEHVLVDFIGAAQADPVRHNRDSAFSIILPHIEKIRDHGIKTFVDCTPRFLGRDPLLLKMLSDATGMHFITNTGFYGAVNNKYIPEHVLNMPAEAIAAFWIAEFKQGIDGTGIRPGFIKIGVDGETLSDFHKTLVTAAALAHKATGLTIMSHTGKANLAREQLDILEAQGVKAEAFIWTHAYLEKDLSKHVEIAKTGAWVSIDGFRGNPEEITELTEMVVNMKKNNCAVKLLLSQDAGWYDPEFPDGSNYTEHTLIFDKLIPELNAAGITDADLNRFLNKNPGKAFTVKFRIKE